jgi:hypothetical protein
MLEDTKKLQMLSPEQFKDFKNQPESNRNDQDKKHLLRQRS